MLGPTTLPQIRHVPISRSAANARALRHERPRYVWGPPTQVDDFSATKTPDAAKHSLEQKRTFFRCLANHGLRKKDFPQCSQVNSIGSFHLGFFSPLTCSEVNGFVGFNPDRKVLPMRDGPRMIRFAMCHLPPHDLEQKRCGLPLSRLVNSLPQTSQILVTVFIWVVYQLTSGRANMECGSTGKEMGKSQLSKRTPVENAPAEQKPIRKSRLTDAQRAEAMAAPVVAYEGEALPAWVTATEATETKQ